MVRIAAVVVLAALACGSPGATPNDAGADAADAAIPSLEQVPESVPVGLADRQTYPDGTPLTSRPWKIIDDCRICTVATLGLKCGRRVACSRAVCVLTDGTELAAGTRVDTAWCHTCTCDATGALTCTRRVDAACPADRCRITVWGQDVDLAIGEERFTGECSVLRCTADGATHHHVCSTSCITHDAVEVPLDHAGLDRDGCAICTCNYGSWCCERRPECPATVGDPGCPSAGTCTTPTGEVVRGGTRWDFGNDKVCVCADDAWTACVCGANPC